MAGLGYKNFSTGDVLTAGDVDNYLMEQTVMVFADAAARTTALTSVLAEGMISYLKDTNSTEYYSGSAWVAIAGSSGGMTSIASGSLSGASVTLSSIPSTYNNLYLVIRDYYASTSSAINFTVNSVADYTTFQLATATTGGASIQSFTSIGVAVADLQYSATPSADNNNSAVVQIFDYANTVSRKIYQGQAAYPTGSSVKQSTFVSGHANTTAAVSSLTIATGGGTFSGGTYILYGVK
jgi:hypothetical protein